MRILTFSVLSLALSLGASAQLSSTNSIVPAGQIYASSGTLYAATWQTDKNDTRVPVVVVEISPLELKQLEKAQADVDDAQKVLKENQNHLDAISERIKNKYSPNPKYSGTWFCGGVNYNSGVIDRKWVVYSLDSNSCVGLTIGSGNLIQPTYTPYVNAIGTTTH
jgi:hypothetical protein